MHNQHLIRLQNRLVLLNYNKPKSCTRIRLGESKLAYEVIHPYMMLSLIY